MNNKNFCSTHHLFFQSNECPICCQERINTYFKKHNKRQHEEKSNNSFKEINKADLKKLVNKFSLYGRN